ncbi:tetratricopeptide repeat protein [Ramlibacter albus]|uniref:Tetratricopeptide repeat protein n=1 Tax=Ramlibacter albus TaxID=2079448 RepID=A0A923M9H3_9BURK|nr:tetratricopeptide repeat protein [Ramlibacter albus]MBC5766141.1 tetratricopeptide repeat protein [Ramlibacter albus]
MRLPDVVSQARRLAVALLVAAAPWPALAVDSEPSQALGTDVDYVAARAAHDRRDWKEAVARLHRAERRFPDNADLHNSLGYAYRQLRQFDAAFKHYKTALANDPRHRGAHEYIGEAYLLVDDLASAEKHVAALKQICLLPCEELRDLEKSVAAYKARKKP